MERIFLLKIIKISSRNFLIFFKKIFFFLFQKSCKITRVVSPSPIKVPVAGCFFGHFTVTGNFSFLKVPMENVSFFDIFKLSLYVQHYLSTRRFAPRLRDNVVWGGGFPPDPPLYGLRPRLLASLGNWGFAPWKCSISSFFGCFFNKNVYNCVKIRVFV